MEKYIIEEYPKNGFQDGMFWDGDNWTADITRAFSFDTEDAAFNHIKILRKLNQLRTDMVCVRFTER